MITYVDTSALIKLLINEPGSDRAGRIWDGADSLVSVSLVEVEARAALAAADRAGRITATQHREAKRSLMDLIGQIEIVEITAELVTVASDLAEADGLRGYDAVHLAAALLVGAEVLTTADADLAAAAARHGCGVADPTSTE